MPSANATDLQISGCCINSRKLSARFDGFGLLTAEVNSIHTTPPLPLTGPDLGVMPLTFVAPSNLAGDAV